MLSECYEDHSYDIPLTVKRYFSMLSIVGIFGCANVLVYLGYGEICRYFLGYAKFVGFSFVVVVVVFVVFFAGWGN